MSMDFDQRRMYRGKKILSLAHTRKDITSPHRNAERACLDLMNQESHIYILEKFTSQEVIKNRLLLRTSVETTNDFNFKNIHSEAMMSPLSQLIVTTF